ncbi:MAG: hypothetical protein M1372_01290 [Patescibacteria group bacterium]|nr:hypothetical protein [Patescibacteria group bacterium]
MPGLEQESSLEEAHTRKHTPAGGKKIIAGQSPEVQSGFMQRSTGIETPGGQIFPELSQVSSELPQAILPISESLEGPRGGKVKRDRAGFVRTAGERGLIEKLPPDMQEVLRQRYLQKDKPKTLSQIGASLNITPQGVAEKEARALKRIRRLLEGKEQAGRRGRPRVEIDINLVARQYFFQGMSLKEIAGPLGVSDRTLLNRLREAGRQSKGRTGRPRKK